MRPAIRTLQKVLDRQNGFMFHLLSSWVLMADSPHLHPPVLHHHVPRVGPGGLGGGYDETLVPPGRIPVRGARFPSDLQSSEFRARKRGGPRHPSAGSRAG
ncbi:hypothetical protein TO73_2399 [Thermus aquaticus Y51MC23]|uniref:Uncharacterized protein n=1 Tax=Thermus aquaticus (strain ATCC BAA-2747 / Y51MC23) TaxID=498848 RepID=A0ABN4IJZ5_THEA5|nr:hypothetical protein TO73_2399 [Thermus aquaticus Y51MC23]